MQRMIVGTAVGATVSRRLLGGRQSFARSLIGAGLGTMVGLATVTTLEAKGPVPVVAARACI